MRILLDCDGVLCDFVKGACEGLFQGGHGRRSPEEFTDPSMRHFMTKAEERTFEGLKYKKGYIASLPRYPGAQQVVKTLRARGHEVRCITAPWASPYWHQERYEWLLSFGFSEREQIYCSGPEKHYVAGDVLVEDREDTVKAWQKANPNGMGIILDRPWNRNIGVEYLDKNTLRLMVFEALPRLLENR